MAFGRCSEPSNVSAGGGQCPLRFRCLGCEHFSTDVSYLPELRGYLDDLLRTRERLQAMATADDWAKREAMPSEEEIARLRRLIRRVSENLESLTPGEQAEDPRRRHRGPQDPPGVPRHPPGPPAPSRCPAGAAGMTGKATAAERMTKGRQADSWPPPRTRAPHPHRDGPKRRGRHRLRARQAGRGRPLVPLPAPGPAGAGPRLGDAAPARGVPRRPAGPRCKQTSSPRTTAAGGCQTRFRVAGAPPQRRAGPVTAARRRSK